MELNCRRVVMTWGLLLAGYLGMVAAQQRPPWPADRIGGIGVVPWGATAQHLEGVAGTYVMSRPAGDSGQLLIYRNQLAGRSVTALFYLDNVRGLVKGVYSAPYGLGECEVVFEGFKASMARLYPSLKPVERRAYGDRSQPFCATANTEKVKWSVEWTDADGNSARVELEPGDARVSTTFQRRK